MVVVELGQPVQACGAADGEAVAVRAFVSAPGRGSVLTWHHGRQHCVEIRLTPFGAYRLFGVLPDLAGHVVTLDEVWGRRGVLLAERLVGCAGWGERFDVLDEVLGGMTKAGREPSPEVVHAWQRLAASSGTPRVADLAAEVGWSRTRLADRFLAQTGLTPKAAASLWRFDRAVARVSASDSVLAEIALSCGYYDQAHLNRDFFGMPGFDPANSYGTCIVMVADTGEIFRAFADGMRAAYGKILVAGIPRMTRPRKRKNVDNLSGFSVVDPGGNWVRFFAAKRLAEEADDATQSRLGQSLKSAVVMGDSHGFDEQAIRILDAALGRYRDTATVEELVSVLAYRAELAVRVDDAAGAREHLAQIREVPLTEAERAGLADVLAGVEELQEG